jgi:hypothetical protein
MLYTAVRYRWLDETSAHMVNYDEALNQSQMIGMLDSNIDGKIEKSEARGQLGEMMLKYWDQLDTDHDGSLDKAELARMQQMMAAQEHRRHQAAPAAAQPDAKSGGATPTAGK